MRLWQAFCDRNLLGATFEPLESWAAHVALLKVLEGDLDALSQSERELVRVCTGREAFVPAREALLLCGRRSGKSRLAAAVAVGLATLRDWPHLAAGEQALVALVSASRTQAQNLRRLVGGIVEAAPLLRAQVTNETASSIEFGRARIETLTASYRTLRGYSCAAVVCDELAHWQDSETMVNPASEILRAVRPSLASMPDSLLLCITTPWARAGAAWELYSEHYGKPGDVFVWTSPSVLMNPQPWLAAEVEREMRRDPVNAATEYGAQFRTDVEAFLSREQVASVVRGFGALPACSTHRYVAFVDSSGGAADSYTCGIAHVETRQGRRIAVVDRVEERRAPFDPREVTQDFADLLRCYGVRKVRGDRYAAAWTSGAWEAEGFRYEPSELTASELYRALVPALLAGDLELPDDDRLAGQLVSLERRVSRGGVERILHPRNAHDDLACACAGVVHLALEAQRGLSPASLYGTDGAYADDEAPDENPRLWRAADSALGQRIVASRGIVRR